MLSTKAISKRQIMIGLTPKTYAAHNNGPPKLTKPFDESPLLIPPNLPGEA